MTKAKPKAVAETIGNVAVAPIAVRDYDAAALLGVSQDTLRRWRLEGKGPVYSRLSSHTVVYPIDELRSYVSAKRVGGDAR